MNYRVLFVCFVIGILPAIDQAVADQPPEKPNILLIYADDLGYGDVQVYNPQRGKIPTPHIDQLASQGMRFSDAHSSSGVCSPSRYTILTGRYHWRSRLQSGIVGLYNEPLIAADRLTIGGLAQRQGYRTATIGKWHLGWSWPATPQQRPLLRGQHKDRQETATAEHLAAWKEVFSQPIANGPTTRGFDIYFGTDVPNWPPYCFIEQDRTIGIPTTFLPPELFKNNLASTPGPALADWKLEAILPALGDRAAQFVRDAVQHPQPFLLYMPLTAPHTPLAVNPEWRGKSGLNAYADLVMETDAIVGQVLKALDESGAADNTLVIFTSDNGCAPYIGVDALEKQGHYPSGPLRGYKADVWEGGHRVPFIVRWPGKVQAGSVCEQLVQQADLMATFADVFGVSLPDNVGEDSFSLLPLLRGEDRPVRQTAVNASIRGVPGLRSGSWKYIPAPGSGGWGKGGDQSQSVQLYNLANDLGEQHNLADQHPQRVAEMHDLLEKLITDGRSTPGARQNNDVKVRRHSKPPASAASQPND